MLKAGSRVGLISSFVFKIYIPSGGFGFLSPLPRSEGLEFTLRAVDGFGLWSSPLGSEFLSPAHSEGLELSLRLSSRFWSYISEGLELFLYPPQVSTIVNEPKPLLFLETLTW